MLFVAFDIFTSLFNDFKPFAFTFRAKHKVTNSTTFNLNNSNF